MVDKSAWTYKRKCTQNTTLCIFRSEHECMVLRDCSMLHPTLPIFHTFVAFSIKFQQREMGLGEGKGVLYRANPFWS